MVTKTKLIKILNLMTTGLGVLVLGIGHITHVMKIAFLKNLIISS